MMTMQEGSAYVRERRALGETILQVATVLAADGWQHDDIVKAFESAEVPVRPAASATPVTPIAPAPAPDPDPAPDPITPVVSVAPVVAPITQAGPVTHVVPIVRAVSTTPSIPTAHAAPIAPIAAIKPIRLGDADEVTDVGLPPSPLRTNAMLVTPLTSIDGVTFPSDQRGHPMLRMIAWILVTFIIGGLFGAGEYYAYKNNLLSILKPYVAEYLPFLPKSL